jgi:hypothetical protein
LAVEFAVVGLVLEGTLGVANYERDIALGGVDEAGGAVDYTQLHGDGAAAEVFDGAEGAAGKVDDAAGPGFGAVVVDAADDGAAVVFIGNFDVRAAREGAGGAGEGVGLGQAEGVPGAAAGGGGADGRNGGLGGSRRARLYLHSPGAAGMDRDPDDGLVHGDGIGK